jgi:hypothetical protein
MPFSIYRLALVLPGARHVWKRKRKPASGYSGMDADLAEHLAADTGLPAEDFGAAGGTGPAEHLAEDTGLPVSEVGGSQRDPADTWATDAGTD